MKLGNRYIFILFVTALLVAAPGGFAHAFGAPIGVLASIAAIQLLVLLVFTITTLASLALGIRAALDKEWRAAASYLGAAAIPVAAWCLAAFANEPGWEAVMGI
jgi:hypothetical protein